MNMKTPPVVMYFENALNYLRKGESVRRVGWYQGTFLKILNDKIVIYLPSYNQYQDYTFSSGDVLAKDWEFC